MQLSCKYSKQISYNKDKKTFSDLNFEIKLNYLI
jgi:hypothetical protein